MLTDFGGSYSFNEMFIEERKFENIPLRFLKRNESGNRRALVTMLWTANKMTFANDHNLEWAQIYGV